MATQTLTSPLGSFELSRTPAAAETTVHRPRSAFRRFIDVMMEARYRQVEHEVARYLARTGNKLTDSVERDIERRFLQP